MSIIKIVFYKTRTGKAPFTEWLEDLDLKSRSIIRTRLDRVALGNFGDSKRLKGASEIYELRIDYGPGYRVYYGKNNVEFVILLIGGEKDSQERDIAKAKKYWAAFKKESSDE